MNHIFIGWDSREAVAFDVCRASIIKHVSGATSIRPLNQRALRAAGLYWRERDPLASTEFTYTRFLVPYQQAFRGWALFCDCDILFRADVSELFALADASKAVLVVKHDHRPTATTKMGQALQTAYPRKNWSSVVLWNCGHPANRVLSPTTVNSRSGAYLHRFQWLSDGMIGELPLAWNYLVGYNTLAQVPDPKAVHFTEGIPGIHPGHEGDEFAGEWLQAVDDLKPFEVARGAVDLDRAEGVRAQRPVA